jgi:AcrR family transcriptional regulator
MTQRDAAATRARILAAAVTEFAEHGLAGGRIERIARSAGCNVRMIYAYFTDKDGLFDAALASALTTLAEQVPPRHDDLPRWAGELFDHHRCDPAALRLSMWAQLERPSAAAEPVQSYLDKTAVVAGSQLSSRTAVDLLVLIYAIAQAWYLTPIGLLASDGSDPQSPERIAVHRSAVVAAAARFTPVDSGGLVDPVAARSG